LEHRRELCCGAYGCGEAGQVLLGAAKGAHCGGEPVVVASPQRGLGLGSVGLELNGRLLERAVCIGEDQEAVEEAGCRRGAVVQRGAGLGQEEELGQGGMSLLCMHIPLSWS
jgi:hypothetical protein